MSFRTTPKKLQLLIRSDALSALVLIIAWQMTVTVIGYILDPSAPLTHMLRWDAGWYIAIVADAYQTNLASAVFYPLYPLLIAILQALSFGFFSVEFAAFIINTAGLWLAVYSLLGISRYFFAPRYRFVTPFLFLAWPTAFFMHMLYTEAIFIGLGSFAYLLALQRKWLAMAVILAFLTATRLPSLLFVALCGLEYLRAYSWNIRKALNKNVLVFLIVPLGFISFGTYLFIQNGNFLGMFAGYSHTSDWDYQVFNPNIFETIARVGFEVLRAFAGFRPFDNDMLVNHILPLLSIGLMAISSVLLIIKKGAGIPIGVIGFLAIIMFTLNSNVVSVHRYSLGYIGIFIATGYVYAKYPKLRPIIIIVAGICMAIQFILIRKFVNWEFAG